MSANLLRKLHLLLGLLLLLGATTTARASHLLGGEMTYRFLDANGPTTAPLRYELTIAVYVTCNSSVTSSYIRVNFYDVLSGAPLTLTTINGASASGNGITVTQTSLSACTTPYVPPGCAITGASQPYQLQKFVTVVNLPATTTGFYAVTSPSGNRNAGINNLASGSSSNYYLTLYSTLAPPQFANSSPVFVGNAVGLICANDTTVVLNNAVDADGDRLVYSFGQPYGVVGSTYFTPPPTPVPYTTPGGYSAATPLGTGAGYYANINAATGITKYRGGPTLGNHYGVAIDVKEYRTINGQEVLLGTTRRDIQLVVGNCPPVSPPVLATNAVLPRSYTIEAGSTLSVPITATQADNHPLTMTATSVLLDGAGGYNATFAGNAGAPLFAGSPVGTYTHTGAASGTVTGTFVYSSTCAEARSTPYDITILANDIGCAGKLTGDVLHITVVKPTGPTALAGSLAICGLGSQQQYTASGGTAPKVQWTVTGGTIVGSATANPVTVQWTTAGTGTIKVEGVGQYGCIVDGVTQRVSVSPAPVLVITGSQAVCQGSSTTLTVTGGTAPYTVTGGAAALTGPGPFVLSPTQTTTYTIASTASGTTCPATGQATITVSPLPAANAGAAATICSGSTAQLGAAPVAGNTYSWSPTTGLSSATVANPTVTLTNTTGATVTQTYTLTETVTASGCQASHPVTVTVAPPPAANAGAAVTICSGSTAQLGAAPVAGNTYSWSPATGLSSATVANPTVMLTNTAGAATTQTYTLTVRSSSNCSSTGTVAVTVNPLPAANAGANVTICSGSATQLGAAPVAGNTYSWSPATGLGNASVANPTVTLNNTTGAAITQTYTLSVTNAAGCTSTSLVKVTTQPLLVANVGAAATICSGGTAQLGAAPVAGNTYSWSPATGLSSATVANPTVTLTNTTSAAVTQTYTLTVTNAGGCPSMATVAVTVNSVLVAGAIGADQAVCVGSQPASLGGAAGASGGTGSYAYQWESSPDNVTWADIAGATGATYAPGVAVAGAPRYYRRRVVSGSCGTATSNVVAVQPQAPRAVSVQLAAPPAACPGAALTLAPVPTNAGPAPVYQWFVNNVPAATTPTFTSSTLRQGDQVRVELTPTAGFCAAGQAAATVTIRLDLPPRVAISAVTPLPVCAGTAVTFRRDSLLNAGTSPQLQWQINGVDVAGAQGATFTTTQLLPNQTVTLVLRTTNACGAVTVPSNVLRPAISPVVRVQAGPDKTIMEGEQVTLEGQVAGSYPVVWTPAATLTFGSDPLRPVAAPLATTTYTLRASVGACPDSSQVTVTVTPRVRIPNAFSPNGDGQDDTWEIDHLSDYPDHRILVFNRWGSKVYEATSYRRGNEWNGTIGGQPAPIGTYYYIITLGDGHKYSGPITVVY